MNRSLTYIAILTIHLYHSYAYGCQGLANGLAMIFSQTPMCRGPLIGLLVTKAGWRQANGAVAAHPI